MEKPYKTKTELSPSQKDEAKLLSDLRELKRSFLIAGIIGVAGGFAMVIIGAIGQITDPWGPFNALFVIAMGILILPAGALCLISSIGMRQRKRWGRTVGLVVLWPTAVLGTLGVITSLLQLQFGTIFLSALVSTFGWSYLHCLRSKQIRAYFSPSAASAPSAQVTNG